ncbi:hypothetical protein FB107DRAFT_257938 [Schizophyllum commune]
MAYVAALLKGDYERAVGLIDCALLTCSAEQVASELLGATSQMNAVALVLGRTPSLRQFLKAQFPATVAQYIQSIHADFVPKLAQYIHFELSDLLDDHSLTDADDLRLASGARHACTILAHGKFPEIDPEDNVDEEEEENDTFFKVKAKGKRQKKRTKSQISVPIDPKAFQDAGYSPPRTRAQAEGLAESMLREIKYLFSVCHLSVLAPPKMIEFDVPEELGHWNIFLSTRAYQDLRKARREDQNRYKIILKKIRHLSKGHFSDDNQKRLSKTSSKVPIYEAKMTGDTRLVYQVDCVADWQNPGMERQVISLYGVFTHAQMDDRLRRIFDAIGKEVGRKGKEYQQRCIYRQRPAVSGDNVFEPATFPLAEETPARDSDEEEIQLPPEDMERVHELLTLDKYFLFSQASLMADVDVAHVFRLSGKELEIVSHVGSCYVLGRSGTGKTTTMLFKILGLERSHRLNTHIIPERPRQLFVTQSHVLVEKVEEAYNKLAKTLDVETYSKDEVKALAMKKNETAKDHLIRSDDKKDQGKSLPQRFSDLKDEHFPLFVNYDRLCQLFEGDAAKVATDTSSADESNLTSRVMRRSGRLVTYELFLTAYWPHFSQKLTKGLDPSLVFSEIMGVIKGSEEASLVAGRCLDRQTYEGLSVRRQSTFANRRGLIYDIFLQYTKEKASRNDYDAADRTYNILRIFQEYGIQGKKIDYLYLLLRYITGNSNGLFWAGDTAQTISVGSAFRFNDLKAYLHRLEEKQIRTTQGNEPRSFQLTTNYRSHGGIVDCAHSIISLIMEYWPDSIDTLARERGQVGGPKPVFLTGWSNDNVRYEQFLFTSSTGNAIEFGAKQCILVRHEEARQRLRKEVGDIGLIMTLYESKGLEFDDVLLFNFFHDSSVETSQWRVVLNAMDPEHRQEVPAPRFDDNLHAGVCSELKFLYVAITRGRKNVWIVDTSDRGEPMRMLLTAREQVENCSPENAPRLAVSSSPDEWKETAVELFKLERYMQAKMCYERAGSLVEAAISHAHYLRQQAALKPSVGHKNALAERQEAFAEAANAFAECALTAETAGQKERQEAYYRAAANAYLEANDEASAARAFIKAGDFAEGAQLYRKLGNFDETMRVVRTYRSQIDETLAEKLTNVSRLYYFQAKEFKKATTLFESVEDALEFLEDTPFDVEKASLLESAGRLQEAAELYLDDKPLHAVQLFLKDTSSSHSVERGWQCVQDGLWRELAYGANVDDAKAKPLVSAYLELSAKLISERPNSARAQEFRMFHALCERKTLTLQALARFFLIDNNPAAAFRSLQGVFHPQFPNIREMREDELIEVLLLYRNYVRLLHDLAFDPAPCQKSSVRRIFGLYRAENGRACFIPAGTFLHEKILNFAPAGTQFTDDGVIVPTQPLTRMLSILLQNRLHTSLLDENHRCQHATVFRTVCLTFTLLGSCNSYRCTRIHPESASLDAAWYNQQVHLHLLQISILNYDIKEFGDDDRPRYQWFWIHKLYETLFPATAKLGAVISLRNKLVPEAQKYFQQVKYWCQDLLKAGVGSQVLTTVLRVAHLSFTFDRIDAPRYMSGTAIEDLRRRGGPAYFYKGQYIVPQLLAAFEGHGLQFINAGVVFFRQVLDAKISTDISALCDLCEYLTGCFVLGRSKWGFHDVTLPKSWILPLVDRFKNPRFNPSTTTLPIFVENLAVLLNLLYNGLESKWCASSLLKSIDPVSQGRASFASRFLSSSPTDIVVVGYNISRWNDERRVREAVKNSIMKVFERPHAQNPIFDQYLRTRSWADLKRAYEESAKGQLMDELITLRLEKTVSKTPIQVPGMPRHVAFKHVSIIPAVIGHEFFIASELRADAPVFVPAALKVQTKSSADTSVIGGDAGPLASQTQDGTPEVSSVRQENERQRPPPTTAQKVVAYRLLCAYRRRMRRREETRVRAARVLQAGYRRLVAFRSLADLDRTRQNFFLACVDQGRSVLFPSRASRRIYYGALPHVLTALDVVISHLESVKSKVKQEFAKQDHLRLEAMSDRLTEVNKALRQAKSSADKLRPRSSTYSSSHCVELLQEHTRRLITLAEGLPSGRRVAIEYDIEMAVASIVEYEERERKRKEEERRKQMEKPMLNTYDDDDCY